MNRNKNIPITYDLYTLNKINRGSKHFYYINDIKKSLDNYKIHYNKNSKKKELEKILFNYFDKLNSYEGELYHIKKIQTLFKNKYNNIKIKTQGIGIINKELCQNKEDFCTFENIYTIDNVFFFSYEQNNFIYFFDIRSFKKLLENDKLNPYTREPIPNYAIYAYNKRINILKSKKISLNFEDINESLTKEQQFQNEIVETLQLMDSINVVAGGISYNTYKNLSLIQLKMFYRVLEDIWNYRAELTIEKKKDIVPLNNMFSYYVHEVLNMKNKNNVEKIILNEIKKLISSSNNNEHRATGCYYVLIALVEISPEFADAMPWLIQHN
jgi:hypothetical protein